MAKAVKGSNVFDKYILCDMEGMDKKLRGRFVMENMNKKTLQTMFDITDGWLALICDYIEVRNSQAPRRKRT